MEKCKELRKHLRQQMDRNKELIQENQSLYALLYEIRKAAGDPYGKLMQDDLVAYIAELARSKDRLNDGR